MSQKVFNSMQLDAIGEVMNISLGSSATAVSNLMNKRVDITTPTVQVVALEDFTLGELEPAIGVEIKYVSGLEGSNIMLLKRGDVKVILDILMGMETPDEEFELNELSISAVCEVMNQMMGAASTALSTFLGRAVNISTPESFGLDDLERFKKERFRGMGTPLVVVTFILDIEDALKSEFVNVMSVDLARELLAGFGMGLENMDQDLEEESAAAPAPAPAPEPAPAAPAGDGGKLSQEEIERMMGQMAAPAAAAPEPAPAAPAGDGGKLSQEEIERMMGQMAAPAAAAPEPAPAAPAGDGGKLSQEEIERMMGQMAAPVASAPAPAAPAPAQPVAPPVQTAPPVQPAPAMQTPPPVQPQPVMQPQPQEHRLINSQPVPFSFTSAAERLGQEQAENLELIMSVPLEVSVEIGRTTRKVEEILTYSKGSLVVLDKLAGDQVDLFVNGMCVARGDVVVVDDNFGIRITEIIKKPGLMDLAAK